MKKTIIYFLTVITAGIFVFSCKKEYEYKAQRSSPEGKAYIKVIDASPGFRNLTTQPDSFHVYADNAKLSGTFLTYNGIFPATGYAAVAAGQRNIRLSIVGKVNVDSVTVVTLPKNFEAGKYYTFIVNDSMGSLQNPTRIVNNDVFTPPAYNNFKLQFIHGVVNDTVGKTVDVYSFRAGSNIFTGVAAGQSAAFINLPVTALSDTLSIRRTGTNNELTRVTTVSFGSQKVYTLLYKGNTAITGTKGKSAVVYTNL
jgi:hypothetical protein